MVVQDKVGHDAWGTYAALLSFGFLFIALADLGINQYATQSLASKPELLKTNFPNLLTVKGLLVIVYPFLMIGAGYLIGYREGELLFLFLLSFVHSGAHLTQFFRANFRALQRFKVEAILSVVDKVVLFSLVIGLLMTSIDIDRFIYARLVSVGITIGLFYALMTWAYGWLRPRLNLPVIKKIIRSSLPFALMTILYSVHDKVDQVMIERMKDAGENGLYAAAYRWLEAFSMYLWTVLPIFFARFAFLIKDFKEQEKLLHFGQVVVALPLVFVSVFVWFHGEVLLFPFDQSTPEELAVILQCLQVLFIAVFFNAIFAIFSTLLTATHHLKFVNTLSVISIFLNIVLNWIFIPKYGAIASAWTTVISFAFMDLMYIVYFQFRMPIKIPYIQMGKILVISALLVGIFWGGVQLSSPWYATTFVAGGAFLGMIFLSRLVSLDQLKNFRK